MREAVVRTINEVILALRRKKSAFWMPVDGTSQVISLTVTKANFTRGVPVELVEERMAKRDARVVPVSHCQRKRKRSGCS
jgi:hypothetical protein